MTFVGTALGTSMWCLSPLMVAADSSFSHQAHPGIGLCVSYMPWIMHTISAESNSLELGNYPGGPSGVSALVSAVVSSEGSNSNL